MPTCSDQKCKRENLPNAPMHLPIARLATAHVRPDGEPCNELPGTYGSDIHAMILDEDRAWAPEFRTGQSEPEPEIFVPPPKVGSAIVTTNAKGDFLLGGVAGIAAYRPDAVTTGPEPSTPITPPAPPAKPARKRAAKKAARAEEDDVDNWEP